jgi:sRNA-binding carbon storage regulator CsrA
MLVLTRRPGDTLLIQARTDAGGDPLHWLARPVEVRILRVDGNRVRIGIAAS